MPAAAAVHLAPLPARAQPHARSPLPSPAKPTAASLQQWNALLASHTRAGRHADALALLPPLLAASEGLAPDSFTLPPAAKSCGFLRDGAAAGRQVHALAAKLGLASGGDPDPFVANSLISMYGRYGRVEDAEKVFEGMPSAARNLVSWNALMAALSDNPRRGLEVFRDFLTWAEAAPDEATLVTVVPMCAALGWLGTGRAVHGLAVKSGWDAAARVSNVLVHMYAKCGVLNDAEGAFFQAAESNVVSWNVMLGGYARNGEAGAAFRLLREMQRTEEHGGVPADEITVLSVLPACSGPPELARLRELHAFTVRRGLDSTGGNDIVPNALIAAYGRCGRLLHAGRLFSGIRSKTVSSWNALISAHAQNGEASTAMELFIQMNNNACGVKPDWFSIGSLLLACANLKQLLECKATHGFIFRNGLERDPSIRVSLLSAYIQCGRESLARALFDESEQDDEVSWNTMIAGYSQNGLPMESLQLFREMQQYKGGAHWPPLISATSALMACSELSAVRLGKELHCFALKSDLCDDSFLSSSLIDMYSKCGFVDDARAFFDRLKAKDSVVSWTTMITGYAVNGLGKEAVALYDRMRSELMEPDEFTYLGLLMACGHAGMLEEGLRFFKEMRNHCKIEPKLEHYACVIGMLSRAGRFADAVVLMEEMPDEPDAKILSSVLSACHIHGEVELGREVAERLLELEPNKAEHYVLASNMYAGSGQWDEMRKVRKMLRETGVAKEPGCSWIDVAGKVYSFIAGDNSLLPEMEEVRRMWHHLEERIRAIGYAPDTTAVLHELEEEEKVEALRWHSEKQAITFGLLRTTTKVRVFKNIRMCKDCHNAAKLISKVTGREIVVRDKKRFHHLAKGICSCGDYW